MLPLCELHPQIAAALGAVVAIALAAALRSGTRASSARTMSLTLFILGGSALASVGAAALTPQMGGWGELLALVPPILVVRHAVYLRLVRRRGASFGTAIDSDEFQEQGFTEKRFARIFARARAANDREFGTDVIAWRYGVPALVMAIVGVAEFEQLTNTHYWGPGGVVDKLLLTREYVRLAWHGARFAAAGAYTYVVLYLGQRSLRRDLSSGAATWAAVTLVAGPIVGGTLALLWNKPPGSTADWTYDSIYFVAGFAPRYAASVVNEAVRRLWLTRSSGSAQQPYVGVPVTQIRGVTPDVADRLEEEGITDAIQLAYADPLKLYRNTAYDKRQILAWIDEALLIPSFGDHWRDLASAGVTGCVDLAARYSDLANKAGNAGDPFELLSKSVATTGLTPDILRERASLLYEDAQVGLVWALYQVDDDGTDDDLDGVVSSTSPRGRLAEAHLDPSPGPTAEIGPFVPFILLGFALAYVFWATVLPFDGTTALCAGCLFVAGACMRLALRATAPLPATPRSTVILPAAVIGFLISVGGFVLLRPWEAAAPVLTVGVLVGALSSAAAGWLVARAAIARLVRACITFDVSPKEAKVSLDGATPVDTTTSVAMREGTHVARIEAEGHRPRELVFQTSQLRDQTLHVTLDAAQTGMLLIPEPTVVPGLNIRVTPVAKVGPKAEPKPEPRSFDGPVEVDLVAGTYVIDAEAPTFDRTRKVVTLKDGERLVVTLTLERAARSATMAPAS